MTFHLERSSYQKKKKPTITWQPEKNAINSDEAKTTDQGIMLFEYNGINYAIQVKKTESLMSAISGQFKTIDFDFLLPGSTESIEAGLYFQIFDDTPDMYFVSSSIKRNKKQGAKPELPIGIGKDLYSFLLDYIQQYSNESQVQCQHIVEGAVGYRKENPITREQWDATFLPILQKHGYDKKPDTHDLTLIKIYSPQTGSK